MRGDEGGCAWDLAGGWRTLTGGLSGPVAAGPAPDQGGRAVGFFAGAGGAEAVARDHGGARCSATKPALSMPN